MSALYDLEPQPTAKVVLQTTAGDIQLELFCKQTPLTCRNFLQLCLDGYYDNTIFHRLVPGFVVQGGDPTGTGEGGEAIYDGGLFADEFHSRLKFNRRGLLGMANTGKKDDNGSQFFLTLAKTEELIGRNTMFGRVVGDTIYNLMRIGDGEVREDSTDRPLYPERITGTEILVNPYDDMVKKEKKIAQPLETRTEAPKKKKKQPLKGAKALLSFGEEDGEDVGVSGPAPKRAKFNPKLFDAAQQLQPSEEVTKSRGTNGSTSAAKSKTLRSLSKSRSPCPEQKRRSSSSPSKTQDDLKWHSSGLPSNSSSSSSSPEPPSNSALSKTNKEIESLKASMRRQDPGQSPGKASSDRSALEAMIPATSIRGRRRKGGADKNGLAQLDAFRAKLDGVGPSLSPRERNQSTGLSPAMEETAPDKSLGTVTDQDQEEAALCDLHFIADCQSCRSWDNEHPVVEGVFHPPKNTDAESSFNDDSWLNHTLSFDKDRLGKDLTWKRKNEEELVVIDPREKDKDIKEEKRRQRQQNQPRSRTMVHSEGRDKIERR